jgi:hypothetical protein
MEGCKPIRNTGVLWFYLVNITFYTK